MIADVINILLTRQRVNPLDKKIRLIDSIPFLWLRGEKYGRRRGGLKFLENWGHPDFTGSRARMD